MIANVTNVEISIGSELNAVRLIELRLASWPSVTVISLFSSSGDSRDDLCLHIDLSYRMILHVDNKKIASRIKTNFVREVESRL